jgi:hypothetical protein
VVLRIFGSKGNEVAGGWRKLHGEELHNLQSSPSLIKMIMSRRVRWTGHVTRLGVKRNACRILVRESEGKRSLGIARCGWVGNIKLDRR